MYSLSAENSAALSQYIINPLKRVGDIFERVHAPISKTGRLIVNKAKWLERNHPMVYHLVQETGASFIFIEAINYGISALMKIPPIFTFESMLEGSLAGGAIGSLIIGYRPKQVTLDSYLKKS